MCRKRHDMHLGKNVNLAPNLKPAKSCGCFRLFVNSSLNAICFVIVEQFSFIEYGNVLIKYKIYVSNTRHLSYNLKQQS